MAKKKKPNEIREEVRKQMAAKYRDEIERLKKLANDRWENYIDATKRLANRHTRLWKKSSKRPLSYCGSQFFTLHFFINELS